MNLLEKYAGKTYSQIFSEFKFPEKDRLEYCHVDTEEICSALQISYSYRSARCEIDSLYSFESGLNWICTDTGVGLNWLFMEKDGEFILVGATSQDARKSDTEYIFFDKEKYEMVFDAVVDFVRPLKKDIDIINFDSIIIS